MISVFIPYYGCIHGIAEKLLHTRELLCEKVVEVFLDAINDDVESCPLVYLHLDCVVAGRSNC